MGRAFSMYGQRRGVKRFLVAKPKGRGDHLEDPDIDGRIIFKWIIDKHQHMHFFTFNTISLKC